MHNRGGSRGRGGLDFLELGCGRERRGFRLTGAAAGNGNHGDHGRHCAKEDTDHMRIGAELRGSGLAGFPGSCKRKIARAKVPDGRHAGKLTSRAQRRRAWSGRQRSGSRRRRTAKRWQRRQGRRSWRISYLLDVGLGLFSVRTPARRGRHPSRRQPPCKANPTENIGRSLKLPGQTSGRDAPKNRILRHISVDGGCISVQSPSRTTVSSRHPA